MKNTVIRTQSGKAINSCDGWEYGMQIRERKTVSHDFSIHAVKGGKSVRLLEIRSDDIDAGIDTAYRALKSLVKAIKDGEKFWDAEDHQLKSQNDEDSSSVGEEKDIEGTSVETSN